LYGLRDSFRKAGGVCAADVRLAAKYPFLREASRLLREKDLTLDKLLTSVAYEQARYRGRERVLDALEDGMIGDRPMATEVDATLELLSYPVARMIVSAVADPMFVKRYAISEAKKASSRLRQEDMAFVRKVAGEMGLSVEPHDGEVAVHFADYLRFSSAMRSKDWKLINQRLEGGKVIVTKHRLARLIEQSLTERISSDLPLEVNDTILGAFGPDIEGIRKVLEARKAERRPEAAGRMSIIRFPPCMRKLLAMIQAGENVPHTGRFALVTFLHALGMDSDEILETFASAPDFDPSKSTYQIQHITGETSGTEYSTPECSTMRSYGICFDPDSLCGKEWMTHPLKYYRTRGKRFKSAK